MSQEIKQYLWILDVLVILLCSYFSAKLMHVYIHKKLFVEEPLAAALPKLSQTPMMNKEIISASVYKVIEERNIFDSTDLPSEEMPEVAVEEAVATGEAVKTSLNIKVFGVLVVGRGEDERSSATVASEGGKGGGGVDTYAVGTENGFAPNTKLIRVKMDRIEFIHNGRLEYALMEEEGVGSIFGPPPKVGEVAAVQEPPPGPPTGEAVQKSGENKFVIDNQEVQNALSNIERLYTEIRAVPNFAGGRVSGMKILSVKQGSLFDKLGLQRGDILERINGMELDVKRGFEIFNQLKTEKHLSVDLVRQGQNMSFEYEIR